ncbi:MAG: NADH:flavin oxidoreductase [Sphingomonadaceae bacterium]
MTDLSPLFEPFESGSLGLPNRIVMAPMTRCFSPGGVPGADVAAYYRRRAEGGVGLIITEGTWIPHESAWNERDAPDFHGEAALAGWRAVANAVHEQGARIMPQLWHVGLTLKSAIRNIYDEASGIEPRHLGPSGIAGGFGVGSQPGYPSMTQRDIEEVVDAYATAAASARTLGFDGIELHAAHGYLIDQFFWHETNRRRDRYGGNLRERARFGAEVVAAIRQRTGPDFPILMRISQWKQHDYDAKVAQTPAEIEQWLMPLVEAGVDMFHCSQRRYWDAEFPGSDLNLAGWVKKITGRPTITVGSVTIGREFLDTAFGAQTERRSIASLMRMLERGEFDLVAVGRALIADADWPRRLREGGVSALSPYSTELLSDLT